MSSNHGGDGDGFPKIELRPPFARYDAEERQYGVIVINDDPNEAINSSVVLDPLTEILKDNNHPRLYFSQGAAVVDLGRNMLIGCEDENTRKYLFRYIKQLRPPHSAVKFIDFFGLIPCSVVLPALRETVFSIFKIFESKNLGLSTDKWAVVGRSEEAGGNKKMEMYIDAESKKFIESQGSTLNFVRTSTIPFKFGC